MGLTAGNDVLLFFYDQRGKVSAVDFNGTYYYYLRNGQGDIVKLIDNSKNTVVEYAYDTWGKQLNCTGTLASTLGVLNPFRYRGYVYDEETQWYYLQSRYYDPTTGRFLSADVMLSTGQGVLGHNTYAYCLNNPVRLKDTCGKDATLADWWIEVYGWLAEADGPYPFGDLILALGFLVCLLIPAQAITTTYVSYSVTAERTETIDVSIDDTANKTKSTSNAIFYGAEIQNDLLVYVTLPMTELEALAWAKATQDYRRNDSWGVWTQHQSDAEHFLQLLLNVNITESFVLDIANQKGYYNHYHAPGHKWKRGDGRTFKHFHVWFGDPL